MKKIKPVLQLSSTECGLCCIAMIAQYYGKIKPLNYYRRLLECGRDGAKVKDVMIALKRIGIDCEARYYSREECIKQKNPYMVIVDNKHFVVVQNYKKNKIRIYDPAIGMLTETYTEFEKRVGKYFIMTKKDGNFVKEKERIAEWKSFISIVMLEKKYLLLMFILNVLIYSGIMILPMIIQKLVDLVANKDGIPNITSDVKLLIICIICYAILSVAKVITTIIVEKHIDRNFNYKVVNKLMKLPYSFFETRAGGDILYRLNMLGNIKSLVSAIMLSALDIVGIIIIIIYMFYISLKMSLMTFFWVLIIICIVVKMNEFIVNLNYYELAEMMELNSFESEMVNSIFEIKSLHYEYNFIEKFKKQYTKYLARFNRRNIISKSYESMLQIFQLFIPFGTLLINLSNINSLKVSIGAMVGYYSVTTMLISNLISFVSKVSEIKQYENSLARINEIIEEKELNYGDEEINEFRKLSVDNVTFSYTNTSENILQNINMQVNKGQKIAIVGASGAGKSTLVKLFLGLYKPKRGCVKINDKSIWSYKFDKFDNIVGVVTQDASFFHDTIMANVIMNKTDVKQDELYEIFDKVGILNDILAMPMKEYTLVSDFGKNLSGGQRQRLALARCLICKPSLIILDEATSSLDSINEESLVDLLANMSCAQIVVSHRLSTIKNVDYIYVIKDKQICEEGTYDDLIMENTYFHKLFQKQFISGGDNEKNCFDNR